MKSYIATIVAGFLSSVMLLTSCTSSGQAVAGLTGAAIGSNIGGAIPAAEDITTITDKEPHWAASSEWVWEQHSVLPFRKAWRITNAVTTKVIRTTVRIAATTIPRHRYSPVCHLVYPKSPTSTVMATDTCRKVKPSRLKHTLRIQVTELFIIST